MTYPESNFWAYLQDERGKVVPGSYREGHNVFTMRGREWLSKLVVWQSLGSFPSAGLDVPVTNERFRWIGVGTSSQLEQVEVNKLVSPLTITTGPDAYIKVVGALSRPTTFSVKFTTTFMGTEFAHHGAQVVLSEAGLFVDVDPPGAPGPSLSTGSPNNVPVAYKTFDPLTKQTSQTLTIGWEFRF